MKNTRLRYFLIAFMFFFGSQIIHAQLLDNYWLMGYMTGGIRTTLDMRDTNISISLSNRNMIMDESNSSISDSAGNLLFYTNGIYIANSLDDTLANSRDFNPGTLTNSWINWGFPFSQATLIIPFPEHSNLYYLFHESGEPAINSIQPMNLRYSIIDMNRNNGLGEVIEKNISLLEDTLYAGELTAVKHANGRDWWVITHRYQSDLYFSFLITNDSIFGPYSQNIGSVQAYGSDGQCVFSPDGKRLARYSSTNVLDVLNFDRCSGLFYDAKTTFINDSAICGGVCFSPDSRLLYVGSSKYVYQFNTDSSNFINQRLVVATWDGFFSPSFPAATNFYKLHLAPNGRIYIISCNGTDYLHAIISPNAIGLSCNIIQHSIQLPSSNSVSLPNYPFYNLGAEVGSVCDSLINSFDERIAEEIHIEVFPNPFLKTITIQSKNQIDGMLNVYNKLGNVVFSKQISGNQNLDLAFLPSGNYVIEIIGSENVFRKGIVKLD